MPGPLRYHAFALVFKEPLKLFHSPSTLFPIQSHFSTFPLLCMSAWPSNSHPYLAVSFNSLSHLAAPNRRYDHFPHEPLHYCTAPADSPRIAPLWSYPAFFHSLSSAHPSAAMRFPSLASSYQRQPTMKPTLQFIRDCSLYLHQPLPSILFAIS